MSTKKQGGTAKNLTDSNAQYLGVKRGDGQRVKAGEVIVRQRGMKIEAGKDIGIGRDHTLFALKEGKVAFGSMRKQNFDGQVKIKKRVSIV
jgi:large subunit ribosomal protein L27